MNSSLAALVKLRSVATLLKTFSLVSIIYVPLLFQNPRQYDAECSKSSAKITKF